MNKLNFTEKMDTSNSVEFLTNPKSIFRLVQPNKGLCYVKALTNLVRAVLGLESKHL